MKRFSSVLAALLAALLLAGCAPEAPAPAPAPDPDPVVTPEPAPAPVPDPAPAPDLSSDTTHKFLTDDPELIARRTAVEAYMRKMGTLIWRCREDILYTITSNITPDQATGSARLELKAGRLYQGIPYSYAGCTNAAFLAYTADTEASGTPVIGGVTWQALSGSGTKTARLGNDCSGALCQAWAQVSGSFRMTSTRYMVPERGYLRVGDYTSSDTDNTSSTKYTTQNGEQKMYEAYALLQMGDGVVYRGASSGHAMMAVEVRVVRKADGTIDGQSSTLTVHEQTRSYFRALKKHHDAALGEDVYHIYGVDIPFSFADLYHKGYLPITCKELIDNAPLEQPRIEDSRTQFDRTTLCEGLLTSNRFMDGITMTITDSQGKTVQQATILAIRGSNKEVNLQRFLTDEPERMHGEISPGALSPGKYHCNLTVRMSTEEEITVRDYDFTVE